MLELVGGRHAGEEQVRVVRLDDVLEHRQVTGLPVQPCSTYVSSETTPASRTAKSAAVEVGNFWARNSAKSPVKPGSPGHDGQLAIARLTEVWKRRTRDRSGVSSSTLISMPAVSPFSAPPWIVTLTSAHSPLRRTATASAALFVREKSTLS